MQEVKKPIDRFREYLNDVENWVYRDDANPCWYYSYFPEFTIVQTDDELTDNIEEGWTENFVEKSAKPVYLRLFYHNTLLDDYLFVYIDHYLLAAPKIFRKDGAEKEGYYYLRRSMEMRMNDMIAYSCGDYSGSILNGRLYRQAGIELFDSDDEAADFYIKTLPLVKTAV